MATGRGWEDLQIIIIIQLLDGEVQFLSPHSSPTVLDTVPSTQPVLAQRLLCFVVLAQRIYEEQQKSFARLLRVQEEHNIMNFYFSQKHNTHLTICEFIRTFSIITLKHDYYHDYYFSSISVTT